MFRRLLRSESGYSLVEVMAAIMLLTIAIIPMVGMFDMGLKSITMSSNYDKARALADTNLEKVRALPYLTAKTAYEPVNASITATNPAAGTPVACDQGVFTCTVTTTYVDDNFDPDPLSNEMQVVVTVEWGASNSYTTTGLKAK